MADNTTYGTTLATPPSGLIVATRQASVSGDTADVQLVTLAAVTGSEGAYTVREVFYADDAAFTPATGGVLATGLLFDDTLPDSVDEGDIGIQRMSANRNAYVTLRDAAGNERGLNVDASGNITVNVNGTLTVGSHAVTNAGTFAVQVDGAALTALQLMDDWDNGASDGASVSGDVAHDAIDGGEPVKIGGKANSSTPTAVAAADRVDAWFGLNGELIVSARPVTIAADGSALAAVGTVNPAGTGVIPVSQMMFYNGATRDFARGDTTNGLDVDVTRLSALVAGSALIGDVGIQGRDTGGTTTFRSIDLDETEEEVKATAGTIYSIHAMNLTTGVLYLKLYNATAANVTVGTTTPTHTYPIPANADTDGAGFTFSIPQGIAFSTAISAAVTTGVADADTGAPAANAAVVHIQYV